MPLKLPSGIGVQMQSPSSIAKHMTMLLYGKAKSGKTTLAASAAAVEEMSPVAVVDFEGSTEAVAGLYDVDVYRCTNWTESSAVLDAMINQHSEHGYKTVVLDPLNALQTQLKDEIIRRQESTQPAARSNNSMGDRGMLQADWDVVWMRMRKIMEAFHAAPFHTIWTAHADTVQDSMTGKMAMEPLFQGTKTKNEATRIPGIVGYIRMVEHNGETVPGVQFAGGAGVLAGDRYRKLGKGMANPTMADIYNKIFS